MLLAAALALPSAGRAQTAPGTISGSVRAADESRLLGARVELQAAVGRPSNEEATTVTGRDGAFRFDAVPDGAARLVVRRLGFRPETLTVDVPQVAGGPIVVLLERVAAPLSPVLVREGAVAGPLPNAFERRRTSGFGHYITRAEIERENPTRTTDLLRSIPGVTYGGPDGARNPRFRAAGGRGSCDPSYYMNGAPVSGTLDLDAMSPKSIESIEVYSGAATVPAALRTAMAPGGCGAIAVWSRMGDAPPVFEDEDDGFGADSLARRVATGWAYTADQVELTANPLPGMGPAPGYPDALRRAGVTGRVTAEFVVDEQGNVDPNSIGIVSSTHPLLSAAVRTSIGRARFSPAYTKGHVVRQVVQLPVVFDPGATASAIGAGHH